ncbi:capsular polysaccharide export protein, LipB/KpsS family [Pacificimonas sp. ICDLI1SI03]
MRRFLFLQGPQGPFFRRLGARIEAAGHAVLRLNLNAGDRHDWPLGRKIRTRPAEWPANIAAIMDGIGTTDLVVYGDCRRDHRVAIDAAIDRGITVHVFEEAYFRPGYMTLERGGVNGYSPLPRTPQAIHSRAAQLPPLSPPPALPPAERQKGWGTFAYYARAHVGVATRRFPHRGWHRGLAPLAEGISYAGGWLRNRNDGERTRQACAAIAGRRYFVLPLQMDADFQLRSHSRYGNMRNALAGILTDFAENAPSDVWLLIKRHPHDNGGVDWPARLFGDRLIFAPTGDLTDMLHRAQGMVTVNSTAALQGLAMGLPVKALGKAIYDVPGLTHRGSLASFWTAPQAPDADLFAAFHKMVIHDAQVPGDHGSEAGLALLVESAAAKLLKPALSLVQERRLSA